MRHLTFLFLALAVCACASKKTTTSSDAKRDLEDRYKNRIGVATKADFVEYFGNAEWCRPQSNGDETCRYYKKIGIKWMGDKTDRKHHETFDQVVANFDDKGTLKSFEADAVR